MSDDFAPDAAEFRCLVPFPDGSDSFVHGFEAGMIWQRMNAGEKVIGGLNEVALHASNEDVFRRMASAQGYSVEITEDEDQLEWIIVTFAKTPKRFGVVDGGRP